MRRTSRTDPWDLVEAYSNPVPAQLPAALAEMGVSVIRTVESEHGDEHLIRCPKHLERAGKADRHPSCWVSNTSGAFICFSCGYSGAFVELVADALDVDRTAAARWVLAHGRRSRDDVPLRPARPTVVLTDAALALYVPPPPEALADRNLTAQACAAYGVLWDPGPKRWILPIRSPTGELLGWQEKNRRHFRNRPTGVKKSKTLFGGHLLQPGTVILVESPLDAVYIHSLGMTGAVAAFGALVSDAQMRLIAAKATRLVLALDNDAAGRAARDALYSRWRPRGLPILHFDYTGVSGKDPGEMSPDEVRRAVEGAYLPFRKR